MSPSSSSHKSLSSPLRLPLICSPLQLFECFCVFFLHLKCPLSPYCFTQLFRPESVHPPPTSASCSFSSALPDASAALILPFSTLALFQPLSPLLCQFFSMRLLDLHLLSPSFPLSYLTFPLHYLFPLPISLLSRHHQQHSALNYFVWARLFFINCNH